MNYKDAKSANIAIAAAKAKIKSLAAIIAAQETPHTQEIKAMEDLCAQIRIAKNRVNTLKNAQKKKNKVLRSQNDSSRI